MTPRPSDRFVRLTKTKKTSTIGGDVVCEMCASDTWCTYIKGCKCSRDNDNLHCLLHQSEDTILVDRDSFVENNICHHCIQVRRATERRKKEKQRKALTLVSNSQRNIREILKMKMPTLIPPPTKQQTNCAELSNMQLNKLFFFFLEHMRHTTNKHGQKNTFRKYKLNKKTMDQWNQVAAHARIFGTENTHETGGEKVARMYHHMTLKNTLKRINKQWNRTTNVINWNGVVDTNGVASY
tara:strand:+ start:322 stop:1038 length:717 start_codon:yes stop_codon:yes gene_type:complete